MLLDPTLNVTIRALDGGKETLTVEVVYETQVLYGTVKAQRQIVVYRD